MSTAEQMRVAERLISTWLSDEEIEHLSGVSLLELIFLRAAAAAAAPTPHRTTIAEHADYASPWPTRHQLAEH